MKKTTERRVPPEYKLGSKARLVPKNERHTVSAEALDDRNTKVRITMYVDLDVLNYFKARAAEAYQPYQTQINAELRKVMETEQGGGDAAASLRQAKCLIDAALRKIG